MVIKDKSLFEFFVQHCFNEEGKKYAIERSREPLHLSHPREFLKDTILVDKTINGEVEFELSDKNGYLPNGYTIKYKYKYNSSSYDDIMNELKLTDFTAILIKENNNTI